MKKVMKIIGYVALTLGCIALVVCLIAIPNETKEFFNAVLDILDRPFILCGVSITIGSVLLFFIIRYLVNNTSFGKKMLNALEKKIDNNNIEQNNKLKDMDKAISVYNHDTEEALESINKEVSNIKCAVSLFPNKKVQEALENGKQEKCE